MLWKVTPGPTGDSSLFAVFSQSGEDLFCQSIGGRQRRREKVTVPYSGSMSGPTNGLHRARCQPDPRNSRRAGFFIIPQVSERIYRTSVSPRLATVVPSRSSFFSGTRGNWLNNLSDSAR